MPYDTRLDARMGSAMAGWHGVTSRKMFGGVCHLLRANMVAGVWEDFLIVRRGEGAADLARELPHVRPFDITGRPMKGWVMIEPAGVRTAARLQQWLGQARAFVEDLPPK